MIFACEKCGSKSSDHDDDRCRISELTADRDALLERLSIIANMRIGRESNRDQLYLIARTMQEMARVTALGEKPE